MTNDKPSCPTGMCPDPVERNMNTIRLSEGSGGREMQDLIHSIRDRFPKPDNWNNIFDDGATFSLGDEKLVFTSDSYVVTPIFFPGGNIGKIAFCGTVNDLAVMGARPIGISLSIILEEGFSKKDFYILMDTVAALSRETNIPVVTGDTKVVERGGVDKIIINTAGVGLARRILSDPIEKGDRLIISGGLGEHGAALLAKRFELETTIETDSKPIHEELLAIGSMIKQAKDITRGGLASIVNELAAKNGKGMLIDEERIPIDKQVRALTEILGIDVNSLACEGRFLCIADRKKAKRVIGILQRFHPSACDIGEVTDGSDVVIQTFYGKTILSVPSGNIVPRIC